MSCVAAERATADTARAVQVLNLFEKCLLLDADCSTKKLAAWWTDITGDLDLMAQVQSAAPYLL